MIKFGTSDLSVGEIAYGCWRFAQNSPKQAQTLIETALGAGMNLIDTADIYGFGEPMTFTDDRGFGESEAVLGEVLKASPGLRDDMVLLTKGGIIPPRPYDSSFEYLTGALEASLRRLKTDRVDVYLIHRPSLTERRWAAARYYRAMCISSCSPCLMSWGALPSSTVVTFPMSPSVLFFAIRQALWR